MSNTDDLDQLRKRVQYLEDRTAILDCIMNQSRGHDRHDAELMASVYHEDGIDEHGPIVKLGPEYGEWANAAHSKVFEDHLHNITTHTCEIDGDVAHAETYVMGAMRAKGGKIVSLMGGRYLDRLERRDGVWKIALRRCTVEWMMTGDSSVMASGAVKGFIKGKWDKTDPSYARPLVLDGEPVERY
ncbi:nuclear transport factor 2 family protein [Mycobacterium sp. Y57]|uniref:nuclear transport factor 2 family protein n=1 Tax=Mycolicibacterium xanthum TaxID=2796469 RepID=UPI001C852D9F|nr:nuclear transport factor 2 family protein [Mycolicibacterium xanthum]MBX7433915.1 nuclear transport factor 2 family protein [Mycolicibacterium xanthum]